MVQRVEFEGIVHEFPDDFTDDDVSTALASLDDATPVSDRTGLVEFDKPRGQRNNNPLNIEWNESNKWQGSTGIEKHEQPRFETFESPVFGFRAATKIFQTYSNRGQNTIEEIIAGIENEDGKKIGGWAPEGENDTDAYIGFIERRTGFDRSKPLDLDDAETVVKLLEAMTRMELGVQPYKLNTIREGVEMVLGAQDERGGS